ncbi:MAG: hypothetical protein V4710_05530, partial [Verrucomicrobiota bacterium]
VTMTLANERGRMESIEVIDLTGSGIGGITTANTLNLTALDLRNLSDVSNTLYVEGDGNDVVRASGAWADLGLGFSAGYHGYQQGTAILLVGTAITDVAFV